MAIRYPLVLNGTTIEELQLADSIDFTSASISGDLTFTGTGARVKANFSDPIATNRLLFQTSTANSTTLVGIMPNGTGSTSGIYGVNSSTLTNASYFDLRVSGSGNDVRLTSDYYGAGTYLPITFYTGGLEQVRITANSGAPADFQFSQSGTRITGDFSNGTAANRVLFQTSTANSPTAVGIMPRGTGTTSIIYGTNSSTLTNASYFDLRVSGSGNDVRLSADYYGAGTYLPITFYTGGAERVRIDTAGNIGQGLTSVTTTGFTGGYIAKSSTAFGPQLVYENATNDSSGPYYILQKGRAGAIVQSGDTLGNFQLRGFDGTNFIRGASIEAAVDGTPGTNDMPGRLVFSTTADGASTPTERMRIDNAGRVGIGSTSLAGYGVRLSRTITGSTFSYGYFIDSTNDATVSNTFIGYGSNLATANAVTNVRQYSAAQATFTGAVTNQYGFFADSSLTGATNNYGFYSNIPSGSGRYNFFAANTADNFFGGPIQVSTSSTSAALRITQTGSGNALVVEDEANPDATPFVVAADGRVVAGYTSTITIPSGDGGLYGAGIEAIGASGGAASLGAVLYNNAAAGFAGAVSLAKSNSATVGTQALVASADLLGAIYFSGSDGTNFIRGAQILANVDGTPGTNDMPGRLVFSTTADGASSPTERMRINSAGRFAFNATIAPSAQMKYSGNATGATGVYYHFTDPTVQSDVTANHTTYLSIPSTQATAFTLNVLTHFQAQQGTIGASSVVTNQYGFNVQSNLTGATNNFGFYSNIPSGTGRWNFYANGTADNYFAGAVGVGGVPYAGASVVVSKSITGSTAGIGIAVDGTAQSDVTNSCQSFLSQAKTAAAVFTLGNYYGFRAQQASFGAGSTITNQYGFAADSSLTGATNNFGFHSNIPSGSGRYNFYAAGNASNYFAGNVGIGGDASVALETFANATNWVRNNSAVGIPIFAAYRSNGTISSKTVVSSGDEAGRFDVRGFDGTNFIQLAQINFHVDGTPGTNDMPGRIVFQTTADGASSPTERMRISNAGNVGIGQTSPASRLHVRQDQDGTTRTIIQNRNGSGTPLSELTFITSAFDFSDNRYAYIQSGGGSSTYLSFGTCNASTPTERMQIAANGYVGIGTAPAAPFHVQTAVTSSTAIIANTGGTECFFILRNSVTTSNNTRIGAISADLTLTTGGTERVRVTSTGNIHGTSGTTAMTDGFFYIPSAAGAPSGVPTAIAGRVPMYYDTTNNNFYVYNGAWKKVLLA
jgi:hypothetical protein